MANVESKQALPPTPVSIARLKIVCAQETASRSTGGGALLMSIWVSVSSNRFPTGRCSW